MTTRHFRFPALAALLLTGLTACAPTGTAPDAPPTTDTGAMAAEVPESPTESEAATSGPLAGTRWQLVEIQSMDDAQGTTKPEDPALYTLELAEDGSLAMRLNCNRAMGTWSAEAGADGTSGSFTIGEPMAMTRALCPPPSLDGRIARDMGYVRGFLLRDGRLALSLMADGGIYLWEPLPESAEGAEVDTADAEPPTDG